MVAPKDAAASFANHAGAAPLTESATARSSEALRNAGAGELVPSPPYPPVTPFCDATLGDADQRVRCTCSQGHAGDHWQWAVRWNDHEEALGESDRILVAFVRSQPSDNREGHCCALCYCELDAEPHAADCPYLAARAYLIARGLIEDR